MKHRIEPSVLNLRFDRSHHKRMQPPRTIDPIIGLQLPRVPVYKIIQPILHSRITRTLAQMPQRMKRTQLDLRPMLDRIPRRIDEPTLIGNQSPPRITMQMHRIPKLIIHISTRNPIAFIRKPKHPAQQRPIRRLRAPILIVEPKYIGTLLIIAAVDWKPFDHPSDHPIQVGNPLLNGRND